MITELLLKTRELYQATYPDRVHHPIHHYMNCAISDSLTKETLVDSGVCYVVAHRVYHKLKATGEEPKLVLLWSHYGPSGMDTHEPEPVHVCIELAGRFYDSINTEGVPEAINLWAARFMRCTEWSTLPDDGSSIFSHQMRLDTPYMQAISAL